MVRPEKLAALKERMEALGIHEQDLEESFVRGSGRGGQKVNKNQQLRLPQAHAHGHRLQMPCGQIQGTQPLSGAQGTVRCCGTNANGPMRRKSPRHPAHEKAERQKEAQAFHPYPLSTGQRITERKSGISARNAEKPPGTSPSTWRIHCGGHSGSPGSPSLPAQSTLSPCWRTTPPYPGEASGTPYRPWGPYPH